MKDKVCKDDIAHGFLIGLGVFLGIGFVPFLIRIMKGDTTLTLLLLQLITGIIFLIVASCKESDMKWFGFFTYSGLILLNAIGWFLYLENQPPTKFSGFEGIFYLLAAFVFLLLGTIGLIVRYVKNRI